jgi:outer membrane protein
MLGKARLATALALLLTTTTPELARADAAPLTLERALALARSAAPRLRERTALAEQAAARADVARAPLLPAVTAVASYQRRTGNLVFQPGVNSAVLARSAPDPSWNTYNFYNLGVSASQLLYDFGVAKAGHDDAQLRAVRERVLADAARLDLVRDVRLGFFELRGRTALVAVAEAYVAHQLAHQERIAAFVEAGLRPEVDLAQIESDLASARIRLVEASEARSVAEAALRETLGLTSHEVFSLEGGALADIAGEERDEDALLSEALAHDPLLEVIALEARAAEVRARGLKGGFGPSLSAVGAVTDAGIHARDLRWNASAGVFLTWPILEGGRGLAGLRAQNAELVAIRARADGARALRVRALSLAVQRLSAAKTLRVETERAQKAARRRLDQASGRYEAGLGTLIELSSAELAGLEAESRAALADVGISAARAQLLHALGRQD